MRGVLGSELVDSAFGNDSKRKVATRVQMALVSPTAVLQRHWGLVG
jgi:hypothetical protein